MKKKRKLNILFISQDTDLYKEYVGFEVPGDPLYRHEQYQELLKKITHPESQIIIITYTKKNSLKISHSLPKNKLKIIPSNSIFRFTFFVDVIIQILILFKNKWKPDLISTQTTWGEAILGLFLSRITFCSFLPQIHTDISSKYWFNENQFINIFRVIQTYLVLRFSKAVRVVSKISAKNISSFYRVNIKKLKISPVGISLQTKYFQDNIRQKVFVLKKRPVVLFVGRIELQKDMLLWVKTAFLVIKSNRNIKFKIVGDGSKLETVRELINQSEFRSNFEIVGRVNYKNIAYHYQKADLFFLSSYHEGFGRVILEAMSYGIPCVSTCSGGPEDLIKNNINGFLINQRSEKKLAEKISYILSDSAYYKYMSNEALKTSHEFSFEKLSKKFVKLLVDTSYDSLGK